MGIVIEFDAPSQARGECCYRLLFPDGDDEDAGEAEYRRFRRAFLKGSTQVRSTDTGALSPGQQAPPLGGGV